MKQDMGLRTQMCNSRDTKRTFNRLTNRLYIFSSYPHSLKTHEATKQLFKIRKINRLFHCCVLSCSALELKLELTSF